MRQRLSEAEQLFMEAALFPYSEGLPKNNWEVVIHLFSKLSPTSQKNVARAFVLDYVRRRPKQSWIESISRSVGSDFLLEVAKKVDSKVLLETLVLEEARTGNVWFLERIGPILGRPLSEKELTLLADDYSESAISSPRMETNIVRLAETNGHAPLARALAERFKKRDEESRRHVDP